jgi:hypothetical protein
MKILKLSASVANREPRFQELLKKIDLEK